MRDDKEIKIFVRKTLGCECPEEVFRHIECKCNIKLDNNILVGRKINIGNRLLIYVVEVNGIDFVKTHLSTLLRIGKDERDELHFNRFRLALVTDRIDEISEVAERIFTPIKERDEKVHLHIVGKNALPVLNQR